MNRLQLGICVLAATLAMGCSGTNDTKQRTSSDALRPQVSTDEAFPKAGVAIDAHRRLGPPVVIDAVTVWPVFTDAPIDVGEFITLQEAQAKGVAELREQGGDGAEVNGQVTAQTAVNGQVNVQTQEVSSGGGASVGTLVLENTGDTPILVLAGTVVKGGKQDRQIGQDFVIKPKSTVPVDAFCVENGRWNANREGKETGGIFQAQTVVATKGVRLNGQYIQDQGKVWEEVGVANSTASKAPATATLMATLEDDDAAALAYRGAVETAIRTRFEAAKGETHAGALVGYAYALEGELVGMRAFAHPKVFSTQWEACLKTIAIEGDLTRRRLAATGDAPKAAPAPAGQVAEFVKQVKTARTRERKARHNVNTYRLTDKGGNAMCEIEAPDGTKQTLTEDFLVR